MGSRLRIGPLSKHNNFLNRWIKLSEHSPIGSPINSQSTPLPSISFIRAAASAGVIVSTVGRCGKLFCGLGNCRDVDYYAVESHLLPLFSISTIIFFQRHQTHITQATKEGRLLFGRAVSCFSIVCVKIFCMAKGSHLICTPPLVSIQSLIDIPKASRACIERTHVSCFSIVCVKIFCIASNLN